eukprot:CAMPEP_0184327524 /NCGR_PEP_ID=MMETSP1049-20130417/143139_1 /TAXON_ID=77928 /ORGANISM="Proteomonas sulcata, Strain CCMP704" /LENGTH=98 /DNA_ID=CAMNT_0026649783 /DNA_START=509 /DNA_END=805 /DNA_ORIENTATION=+
MYKAPSVFGGLWSVAKGFLDPVTSGKITFISGDTSPGSTNDSKLKSILGDNWRDLTKQDEPAYGEGGSRGYNHADSWNKAELEEAEWLKHIESMDQKD